MKFKYNGDTYLVHPVAVKVMQVVAGFAILLMMVEIGKYI